MGNGGERMALAVCSDRNMGLGITIWDVKTGQTLLHIPTCASPPYGLICLRNEFLVASQTRKEGSVGGGSIFIWSLNKPQPPVMSYTLEPIGPLASTKDSVYLAGGTHSGNIHLWEVGSGKLLKLWSGHHKPIKRVLFSWDDSFLITGSADGMICVWSMIGLLDVELVGSSQPIVYCLMEHKSSLTGLLTMSGCSMSIIISSSLDGSLKFWDLMSGMIRGTQAHIEGITAIVLHPTEQVLFSGIVDGQIFASRLEFGFDNCINIKENQLLAPKGHKGAITALAFSQMDLISASEDCTVCIWDISSQRIIQKLDHKKGRITNLVAVPQSSLISTSNRKRVLNQFSVSSLDKYPQPDNLLKSTIPLFPSLQPLLENLNSIGFTSTGSLNQQILDTKTEGTSAAIQMKVETNLERRMWASRMTKQVMDMNNHLQSRLVDMMRIRLFGPVSVNGQVLSPPSLLAKVNEIGGKHGIGRIDMVENRLVGMKSRGVYETPGGTILFAATRELESLTLDRETIQVKDSLALKYAELVYAGRWFDPLRESMDAFMEKITETTTGSVTLKLYKGSVHVAGRRSLYSLYREDISSFENGQIYNQADAAGFIRLYGLPTRVRAMLH